MSGTVLICGATGLLGTPLSKEFERAGHHVIRVAHHRNADYRLDLRDTTAVKKLLNETGPELVVNLVAATDIDFCERNPHDAYFLNAKVVENLAQCLRGTNSHLVHISTDQVYDGPGREPNPEGNISLGNFYAYSKYVGEQAALAVGSTVLRTNFFGRSQVQGRASFSDWLYQAFQEKQKITLVTDVFFSPLSIASLCERILQIAPRRIQGTFNLGSREGMSKADFGLAFARLFGFDTSNVSLSVADKVFKSHRPKNMLMNCDRIARVMGLEIPRLADEIEKVRSEYA